MIYSLRGIPIELEPFFAIIDCGGVGYGVRITGLAYDYLSKNSGLEIFLHTRSVYKEDSAELFGFRTSAEAKVFDVITEMQGFGPAIAMNLLSTLGAEGLLHSLIHQDPGALVKVPKVGKGKAEKILFEARSKQQKIQKIAAEMSSPEKGVISNTPNDFLEMIHRALEGLGFQKKEIEKAAEKVTQSAIELSPKEARYAQEYIREYLKYL